MFRKNRNISAEIVQSPQNRETSLTPEQEVADSLSVSDVPGKYFRTRTIRDTNQVIHLGEEMEHRQRGYTLVIPDGSNAAVFEVLNNSPFSGFQYYIEGVYSAEPKIRSESFLGQPAFSVADIPVGRFGFVKQLNCTDAPREPGIEKEHVLAFGRLTPEQQQEMALVNTALHAIHSQPITHG